MVRFSSSWAKSSSPFSKHRRSNHRTQSKHTHKQTYDGSSKDEDSAWSSVSSRDHEERDDDNDVSRRSSFNYAAKSAMAVIRDPKPTWVNGSYNNIAPLPTFKGLPNECPVTHLSRFNKVCRANNAGTIGEMVRIFPVTLEDEAGMWYDLNIEPYSSISWEEVKEAFLQAYGGHYLDAQFLNAKLANLHQEENEGIRSYFLKLQWMLKQCPDHRIPEDLIKELFVGGLRGESKKWVVTQKPESLNEALRVAFEWERMEGVRRVKEEKRCGFCDGFWHEERECEVRERMRELWWKSRDGGGGGEEEGERERSEKKSERQRQCQCSKHECRKKKLERNCSRVSAWSSPAD